MNYKLLLIEDEQNQREALSGFLVKKGYDVKDFSSWTEGVKHLKQNHVDMILTDFKMPDKTGADVLNETQELNPDIPVVVMTAYGDVERAVGLMKNGAFDYLQKPVELDELLKIIEKAKNKQLLKSENDEIKTEISDSYSFESFIYKSAEIEEVLNTAGRVAKSKASVMIRGESGTGKELIARIIHNASDRKDKPFVIVNCAAMPETLFESELFGHEKGSFTGANKQRTGKFEEADGGTLFIDEVGDIPLPVQVKLLRAVQFGEFERLGSNKVIKTNVRIITATNKDLEEMIKSSEFREDLYYRFNVVTVDLPPLRNRKNDIPLLIDHFIKKYSELNGKNILSISKEALSSLMKYDFPGNVRELENIIQRAVVMARGDLITSKDLPAIIISNNKQEICKDLPVGDMNKTIEEIETKMILKALNQTGGNQVKAADMLNISERTIRYKIQKYGIKG